jgi:AraC-like DNA-binding protein
MLELAPMFTAITSASAASPAALPAAPALTAGPYVAADWFFRGGAIALILLVGVQLVLQRPIRLASWLWLLFGASTIIYVLEGLNGQTGWIEGPAALAIKFPGFLIVVLFWMFTQALIDENYRPDWLAWTMVAVNAATFFPICVWVSGNGPVIKTVHLLLSLALIADAMRHAIGGLREDLVENRRRALRSLILIIPVIGIVIGGFVVLETVERIDSVPPAALSGVIFATILVFASTMSALRDDVISGRTTRPATSEAALPPADRIEIARLHKLMGDGVYLEPNLSIGALAAKLNLPEHRLRRLINNHLGYRNFAAFINDHRIDEAKRRLADVTTARDQITGLAFDLGFASLAPFNRAFRERAGVSPSEFRTKALENALLAAPGRKADKLHS